METTVFYAWQSDRDSKTTKNFIRIAAEEACKRINNDEFKGWNLQVDSDTRGVPGMCDIPNEILKKIRECGIFLADLTIVGKTDCGQKLLPNANVVYELGYAAANHGFGSLVAVVNTSYGELESLPFDIKRRFAIKFECDESMTDVARRAARDRLSSKLEEVFRLSLSGLRAGDDEENKQAIDDARQDLNSRLLDGRLGRFPHLPAYSIALSSRTPIQTDIEQLVYSLQSQGIKASVTESLVQWQDSFSLYVVDFDRSIFYMANGQAFHSFRQEYQFTPHARLKGRNSPPKLVRADTLQMNIVRDLFQLCKQMQQWAHPPFDLALSLVKVNGFAVLSGDTESRASDLEILELPVVTFQRQSSVSDAMSIGTFLRPTLSRMMRHFGEPTSYCYDSNGNWNMRVL